MFIEKLTDKDLENYAYNWYQQNLSGYSFEDVDIIRCIDQKSGKLLNIDLNISYFSEDERFDEEKKYARKIVQDFALDQFDIEYFINKFGLDYIKQFNKFLKNKCTEQEAERWKEKASDIYNQKLFKNQKQKKLDNFIAQNPETDQAKENKNFVNTTLDRFM